MQPEEEILETWSDGVLCIQHVRVGGEKKRCVMRVTACDVSMPGGTVVKEDALAGLSGGVCDRHEWSQEQCAQEFADWHSDIAGDGTLSNQDKWRHQHAVWTLEILFNSATTRYPVLCAKQSLRRRAHDTFVFMIEMYKTKK